MRDKTLRVYIPAYSPYKYGIRCDVCNSDNIQWSEFEGKIWCQACEVDTKGTCSDLSGPVPVETSKLLIGPNCFDYIILRNRRLVTPVNINGKHKYFTYGYLKQHPELTE